MTIRTRIQPHHNGWLATCLLCGWETYKQRRPILDKALHTHKKTHQQEKANKS